MSSEIDSLFVRMIQRQVLKDERMTWAQYRQNMGRMGIRKDESRQVARLLEERGIVTRNPRGLFVLNRKAVVLKELTR